MRAMILKVTALLTVAGVAAGLAVADSYPKNFDIDVLHYAFEVRLSDTTDRIDGVATLQVRFLADGVESFEIDLVNATDRPLPGGGSANLGMTVASVGELALAPGDGTESPAGDAEPLAVAYRHAENRLRIGLSSPSRAREIRRFRIAYSGVPARGLIIGDNMHGDRTFFSDNWPDWARDWLPVMDHPYEKATAEMMVTAPSRYQVISNGLLVEQSDLAGAELAGAQAAAGMPDTVFRRSHWKQSVPIPPWLFVLGVAEFAVDYYDTFDGKSLQTWVYRQDREAGFYDFAVPTKHVMQYYTDTIGPYAYEKLANVQSNSVGGGMEAASAIFYGDNSVTGERTTRWRNVVIHEIAHQWWGNAVTENDWDHVWLSEGFATYFTLLYREHAYGRDDFVEGLREARRRILDYYADDPDYRVVHDNLDPIGRGTVTNGMTYQRGAWFLHMLRGQMGDDRFWAGIREYYRRYRDATASTDDFREVMENTFEPAIDLSPFFAQWLYQGGVPDLRGEWWWDAGSSELVIELEQIAASGYIVEMPIPVRITVPPPATGDRGGAPQVVDRSVMMPATTAQTRIALDREPDEVLLDPDLWVLMEFAFGRR